LPALGEGAGLGDHPEPGCSRCSWLLRAVAHRTYIQAILCIDPIHPMTPSPFLLPRWKLLWVGLLTLTLTACLPIPMFEVTPSTAHANESLSFDASSSLVSNVPKDTVAVGWAWTFGDGGTAKGEVVTHTYAKAGTYSIELTVTDSAGRQATVKESLEVKEAVVTPTDTETESETTTSTTSTTTSQ
jgi:hypothetical protein